ncbi:hypothetical protein I3843_10G095200 [Carya illinoinensis]|nr:hypothetical protein I3843_10G095200 [Carya illinoinensis]
MLTNALNRRELVEIPHHSDKSFTTTNYTSMAHIRKYPIPFKIFNSSTIQILFMEFNKFSGHLPSYMGLFLPNLKKIDLSNNSLSGIIPEALGNLKLLEILSFSFNPLHSFLPNSNIGNLSLSLQRLYLHSFNIKGSIPVEIENLSSLILLDLANNELKGPIPTTLGRLHMLQASSLSTNELERDIPSYLCHLKSLYTLILQRNKLFGHIPVCISNLTSLRYLYLDLLEVKLSSNSLTGVLSLEIGDMKVLKILNLSSNQLLGDIPITIGGLIDLTDLSLAVNQLEGSIPESFSALLSLDILDLSYNNLSGRIPKCLEALLYLKYLNVSFNNLRGKIPTGGPFVHFWPTSFISNDAFCGEPRLQVPPCEEDSPHKKKAKVSHLMKYLLPAIGLAMLVVIPSLAYKRCKTENPGFQLQADSFNSSNSLGEGSFGSIYKGTLSDGMNIAIKVINLQVEGAFKCFDAECEVLQNARHRNLAKIISICSNINFKALILEYMPNENLEKWLYSHDRCLNFLQRLNIMIDVASTLEYLHYGYSKVIIHCDLKPSNVLLDVDMVAHVADFGMAKLLGDENSTMLTMTLTSLGYMAPDDMFVGEMSLKRWVNKALLISTIDNIVDAGLLGNERYHVALKECIYSIMGLALDCCAELPKQRTNMKMVLVTLKKIKTKSLRDVEEH